MYNEQCWPQMKETECRAWVLWKLPKLYCPSHPMKATFSSLLSKSTKPMCHCGAAGAGRIFPAAPGPNNVWLLKIPCQFQKVTSSFDLVSLPFYWILFYFFLRGIPAISSKVSFGCGIYSQTSPTLYHQGSHFSNDISVSISALKCFKNQP